MKKILTALEMAWYCILTPIVVIPPEEKRKMREERKAKRARRQWQRSLEGIEVMGCLGGMAAVILFSAGIDRLDKNPILAGVLIGLAIVVGLLTWRMDRKDDENLR